MAVYLTADPEANKIRFREIYDMLPEPEQDTRRGGKNRKTKERNSGISLK
jgi:hypothetical protein